MITITLINIDNLNASLQVGDMIYVTTTTGNLLGQSTNQSSVDIDESNQVGILRRIEQDANVPTTYTLHVDDFGFPATVTQGEFLMFSKYNQSDGDIKGYYMEVKLVNNSRKKAKLFSLSSEVTESSK